MYSNLFSPLNLGNVELKNRIVFTGHATCLSKNGLPDERLIAYQTERAKGGAGLIVTQVSAIHPSGWDGELSLRMYSDEHIKPYQQLANAVHRSDGRVFGQLFHPGREVHSSSTGTIPVAYAPSAVPTDRYHIMPRVMTTSFVEEIVESFGEGARRFQEAGYDGVEVVGTQGYLIATFMNPQSNLRTDRYGGDFNARLCIVREVVQAIRRRCGDFSIGLRISGDEWDTEGLKEDEVVKIAAELTHSLDYLSIAGGTSATLGGAIHIVPPMAYGAGYLAENSHAIRIKSECPVILTGRINQPQVAEQIIVQGQADACGMTRAMICDPYMPVKAQSARSDDIRACIGCNQACIGHFHRGYPISCIQHPETGRELEFSHLKPTDRPRTVMVIGAGPAGMKAAAIAAKRGHRVTLYEKAARLGGQALLAQLLPGRAEFGGIVTNLTRELLGSGAQVETGVDITADMVSEIGPDALILATGATPRRPSFEGQDEAHVVDVWQVLQGEVNVGSRVVVADWRSDWIGAGVAEKLALDGCSVRLCVGGHMACENIPNYVRDQKLGDLHKLGITIVPMVKLFGTDQNSVYFEHISSREAVIENEVDTLVLALGHDAASSLSGEINGLGIEHHVIGDCASPRTAEEAVYEGLIAGVEV